MTIILVIGSTVLAVIAGASYLELVERREVKIKSDSNGR